MSAYPCRWFALSISVIAAGCHLSENNISPAPSISAESHAHLEAKVNCHTATHDIKVLEEERASVGRQMVAGVRSVLPLGVVVGILSNDYNDRVEVATGDYNATIERKIEEIRSTCGLDSHAAEKAHPRTFSAR